MIHTDEEILTSIDKWALTNLGQSFTFRQFQRENILAIVKGIVNDTYSTKVIEAPTGSGKSIIIIVSAGVLADFYNKKSYILCSDLFLWNQYEEFIKKNSINFGTIKGQTGNYNCVKNGNDMKNAECRMAGIPWKALFFSNTQMSSGYQCAQNCEYVQCRKKCMNANVVLMTYQLFLYQMNMMNSGTDNENTTFPHKDVIFCDECHNIPDIVQSKFTPTVTVDDLSKMSAILGCAIEDSIQAGIRSQFLTQNDFYNYLTGIYTDLCNSKNSKEQDFRLFSKLYSAISQLKPITDEIQNAIMKKKRVAAPLTKKDRSNFKLCTFFQNYMCYLNDFSTAIDAAGLKYFIKQLNTQSGVRDISSIQFHCAKEDMMIVSFLLEHAKFRVLLSATTGGYKAFNQNTGLDLLDDARIEFSVIPSTFDFTQSEICIDDEVRFTYANRENAFSKIKEKVFTIVRQHLGEKGIVQTGSYENAYKLYNTAPDDVKSRMLLYSSAKEKTEMIKMHKHAFGTVLVGPTLCEGIDFPDGQCRFIVVMKVPYPSLADKLVSAKLELFPDWYSSKTSNAIIQGLGRGIRHKTDWCKSYILDGCFARLLNDTFEQYPEEMRKRFIRV